MDTFILFPPILHYSLHFHFIHPTLLFALYVWTSHTIIWIFCYFSTMAHLSSPNKKNTSLTHVTSHYIYHLNIFTTNLSWFKVWKETVLVGRKFWRYMTICRDLKQKVARRDLLKRMYEGKRGKKITKMESSQLNEKIMNLVIIHLFSTYRCTFLWVMCTSTFFSRLCFLFNMQAAQSQTRTGCYWVSKCFSFEVRYTSIKWSPMCDHPCQCSWLSLSGTTILI